MGDKKSPTRPKRQAKPSADDGFWDCSVCTFRNSAEAFKCSICDVRKGTSTRDVTVRFLALLRSPPQGAISSGKKEGRIPLEVLYSRHRATNRLVEWLMGARSPSLFNTRTHGSFIIPHQPNAYAAHRRIKAFCKLPLHQAFAFGMGVMKPRINSQLVAQQVAQQYATPPPPKKEKKEKPEKDRGEGEQTDRNPPDSEYTDKDKDKSEKEKEKDKEQPEKEKKDREITPAITKKPNSKKNRPKSDIHHSPPSERNSIQSGKSTTKTKTKNKNSHISRPKLKNIDRSTAQQLAITVGNVTVIITDFKEKTRTSSTSSSTVTSSVGSELQHQSSGSESMDKGSSRASTPKGDLSIGHDESF
ncbi:B Death effector domain-associated factor [Triplophysa tibetana]|uniref:B Death effector domain-associated factor n=1 Tax=Triplophysa tibetana TaxID=1572043 RepID=A0A5A9NTI5_9TELE|nr:B Death effector domain-associated factor [Triplophysa tibetana]